MTFPIGRMFKLGVGRKIDDRDLVAANGDDVLGWKRQQAGGPMPPSAVDQVSDAALIGPLDAAFPVSIGRRDRLRSEKPYQRAPMLADFAMAWAGALVTELLPACSPGMSYTPSALLSGGPVIEDRPTAKRAARFSAKMGTW